MSSGLEEMALARDLASAKTASDIAAAVARHRVAPNVAVGCAVWDGVAFRSEVGGDTDLFFDLASLTKPFTAVAIVRAGLPRRATLEALLPELAGTGASKVTLEALLAHRAGLAAHLPLFEPLLRGSTVDARAALREAANAVLSREVGDASGEDGAPPLYSDLGYLLAGVALARSMGEPDAGRAIDREVIRTLGLQATLGTARELEARGVALTSSAAPTEVVSFRGGEVRGRVHDENAWALTGIGGSGHAGLFGTASAVLIFAGAVLGALRDLDARLGLTSASLGWLVRERPGGTLRAGFDGKSPTGSSVGSLAGPNTFGHLGFTGTSFWIDPDDLTVVVVLTNRVHPTRNNDRLRGARPAVHDALFRRAAQLRTT